ncbi:MAG: trimeric intracellular cation channel family protein [Clostridia bacterium]|nr:trimeric intracellular cation channel family protein [Clostridia bacterium]
MNVALYVIELFGVAAFAISGALVAIEKKMDLFGVAILGFVTATGGGVLRDLILGITPPMTFRDPSFAIVALVTSLIMFIPWVRRIHGKAQKVRDWMLLVVDSLGLGTFAVVGMGYAIDAGYGDNVFLLIFVGVVTSIGGGIFRDIMAGNRPYVFVKHFYATAALIGCIVFVLMRLWAGEIVATIVGASVIFVLRILAAVFRWKLPVAHDPGDK